MFCSILYTFQNGTETITQVDLNVQRINITLARGVSSNGGPTIARKVATVTFVELVFSAELGHSQIIQGSLGAVEVLDLTPECLVHRCVLSIGESNQTFRQQDSRCAESENKAFAFRFSKLPSTDAPNYDVHSHIASACYAHSPEFLSELLSCAGDFRDYAASAAKSIQTAAADVAKEFVAASDENDLRTESMTDADNYPGVSDRRKAVLKQFSIFVCVETPVIVLPRVFNSPELLVGNLGRITVRNLQLNETGGSESLSENENSAIVDRIFLDISNVSLYSLTLDQHQVKELALGKTTFSFLKQRTGGSSTPFSSPLRNSCRRSNLASLSEEVTKGGSLFVHSDSYSNIEWIEILHETGFQLIFDRKVQSRRAFALPDPPYMDRPSFKVEAKILRAVKLELSSKTYSQLLETLNSLSVTVKNGSAMDDQIMVNQRSLHSVSTPSDGYVICYLFSIVQLLFGCTFFRLIEGSTYVHQSADTQILVFSIV